MLKIWSSTPIIAKEVSKALADDKSGAGSGIIKNNPAGSTVVMIKDASGNADYVTLGATIRCEICFDNYPKAETESRSDGIYCNSATTKHFICADCLSSYVKSMCEDFGVLKDHCFTVCCPVMETAKLNGGSKLQRCSSLPWSSSSLRRVLRGEMLDLYLDTLVKGCRLVCPEDASMSNSPAGTVAAPQATGEDKEVYLAPLLEALNLKCPRCGVVFDPSPDGCAAVRCSQCSTYVCFMCFDARKGSSDCHAHVRKCNFAAQVGTVFQSEAGREAAHKRLRIIKLREALLLTAAGNPHRQGGSSQLLSRTWVGSFFSPQDGRTGLNRTATKSRAGVKQWDGVRARQSPLIERALRELEAHLQPLGISVIDVYSYDTSSNAAIRRIPKAARSTAVGAGARAGAGWARAGAGAARAPLRPAPNAARMRMLQAYVGGAMCTAFVLYCCLSLASFSHRQHYHTALHSLRETDGIDMNANELAAAADELAYEGSHVAETPPGSWSLISFCSWTVMIGGSFMLHPVVGGVLLGLSLALFLGWVAWLQVAWLLWLSSRVLVFVCRTVLFAGWWALRGLLALVGVLLPALGMVVQPVARLVMGGAWLLITRWPFWLCALVVAALCICEATLPNPHHPRHRRRL